MIFLIFPLLYLSVADSLKGVHLGTLQVYEQDSIEQPPSEIERVRLRVTKTTTDGFSDSLIVHIIRLQWTNPRFWNDGDDPSDRSFSVICEADESRNNETFSLIDVSVSADITAIHERFVLPPVPLSLLCAVRAENSKKIQGGWKYSPMFLIDSVSDLNKNIEMDRVQSNTINEEQPRKSENLEEITEDLKKQLKSAKLIEIPFPAMKPRESVHIHSKTQKTEDKDKLTTNSTVIEISTHNKQGISVTKKDDISPLDSHLFLRGLSVKSSNLLTEEGHPVEIPIESGVFGNEDDLTMAPSEKLSQEVESDYDLLEQRIRDAIGSVHDRVL